MYFTFGSANIIAPVAYVIQTAPLETAKKVKRERI
jgi:hypothetical protein